MGAVCDRFRLDYYIEGIGGAVRPDMRYCVCGWTEAHHSDATESGEPFPELSGPER